MGQVSEMVGVLLNPRRDMRKIRKMIERLERS